MTQQVLQGVKGTRRKARGFYRPAPGQQVIHRRIEELRGRCVPVSEIAVRLYASRSTVRRHLACECNCLNGKGGIVAAAETRSEGTMRGTATAIMLGGLLWQAYWMTRIAWGTQGTLPLLAFVGGLLVIAGSTACLSQPERSPDPVLGPELPLLGATG